MSQVRLRSFVLASILISSIGNCAAPESDPEESIIRAVDQGKVDREANLTGYSVTEHYTLRNTRFQTGAEMTVATVYSKGAGKSFQTLSRSGSSTLQSSVLEVVPPEIPLTAVGNQKASA